MRSYAGTKNIGILKRRRQWAFFSLYLQKEIYNVQDASYDR